MPKRPAMTELRTPRLLLRRATPDDLPAIHAVLSDPRATRYWSTPPHGDLAESRQWLDAMITSPPEASDDFIITLDGEAIGKIGAYRLPEFGFIITPEHWGKGLASEALAAFLAHVFERPDVTRLIADVDPRNLGSLALLRRHGFVETGRANGTWETHLGLCDSVYLALDESHYRSIRRD